MSTSITLGDVLWVAGHTGLLSKGSMVTRLDRLTCTSAPTFCWDFACFCGWWTVTVVRVLGDWLWQLSECWAMDCDSCQSVGWLTVTVVRVLGDGLWQWSECWEMDCDSCQSVGRWTVTVVRVLGDGLGHTVVGILCPSFFSSWHVLDFSVRLD